MIKYAKPKLIVSECLGFSACRYNGQKLSSDFVTLLKKYSDIATVCPEVEIGLGIPRDPIRIINVEDEHQLYQPKTERYITKEMQEFSDNYFSKTKRIDGFVMKSSSPSCGTRAIPIYKDGKKTPEKRDGMFVQHAKKYYPNVPMEDEGRLNNFHIRENYLTRIFTLAKFRELNHSMKALVSFQAENKYLFMTLHPKTTTELGQIVANQTKQPIATVFELYEESLFKLLHHNLQKKRTVNSLQHIFGYFSNELTKDEKSHFLSLVDQFRHGKELLFTINQLLWSWILRYDKSYLKQQTFFNPYPPELMDGVNISSRLKF